MTAPITADRMMQRVELISKQFPHRHMGEEQEAGVARYIADESRELGLSVRVHEIPVMGWELVAPPRLEITAPEQVELICVPFIFSGSTPRSGFQGELEYVGPTLVVGIAPEWEKYAIVEAGQPRALIVGRPAGEAVTQSGPPAGFAGTQDGPHYTWPSCVIGRDDLARLERWRGEGSRIAARLVMETRYKPGMTTYVVEATLAGRTSGDEMIVIGAHHDTQGAVGFEERFDSPGACDNASGVAALLELARFYREEGYPRTLRFCTYGGEEWNLVGSRQYVRTLAETRELPSVTAAVNLDQTAHGETLKVITSGPFEDGTYRHDMSAIARDEVAALGLEKRYTVEFYTPPFPGSDHWPYHVAGVPVFYAAWDPVPRYHSSGDTAENCVEDNKYEDAVSLAQRVLTRLAHEPPSPAARAGTQEEGRWRQ